MTAISDMRRELARLDRQRLAAVRAAAARVRRELIVPLCREHGLTFASHDSVLVGGSWLVAFLRGGKVVASFGAAYCDDGPSDAVRKARELGLPLGRAIRVLAVPVLDEFPLGVFVQDYASPGVRLARAADPQDRGS